MCSVFQRGKKRADIIVDIRSGKISRHRATLPQSNSSTIAAEVLNVRVREGNGCCYLAMGTGKNMN